MNESAETLINRLKQLDFAEFSKESPYGFSGFVSIGELIDKHCEQAPLNPGIYIVSVPKGFAPKFLPESPVLTCKRAGKQINPSVSVQCLEENWVEGTTVIYIGKAGNGHGKATLRSRLKTYMRFGSGKPAPHRGGRYIWQLECVRSCLLAWMHLPEENPKEAERFLIKRFAGQYGGRYPFANLCL
jgi:hypothetical protein